MRCPLTIAVALTALTSACSVRTTPEPTPRGADLAAMNGYWIGEYSNSHTGKAGTMTLSLRTWTDSVAGDLVMVPRGSKPLLAADVATHSSHAASAEVLRVSFTRVSGGMVEGAVEAHFSPDCACVLQLVLQSTPLKNLLAGEFVLTSASGLREQGRWSTERLAIVSR